MANVYFANQSAHTPSTNHNWVLDAGTTITSNYGRILEVSWGGELTTTQQMRTRWLRPNTSATTTFQQIGTSVYQSGNPQAGQSNMRFGTFTTVPTIPTAPMALYATSWNAHGGIGRWLASPGEEWTIIAGTTTGKNQVVCVNDVGLTPTSMSCGVAWEE